VASVAVFHRFGDMKLLLSNDLTPDSRVLYIRNIRERLSQVAPFCNSTAIRIWSF